MALFDGLPRDFDALREQFRWEIPRRFNIGLAVCDAHAESGGRALVLENAAGKVRTVGFDELKERSDEFANALLELGVERGDRVGIILPQRLETALAHIAAYKIGAVALPLSGLFGPDALEYRLADSAARLHSASCVLCWRARPRRNGLGPSSSSVCSTSTRASRT